MRKVIRNYNDKPRKLTLNTTTTDWNTIAFTGNKNLITGSVYRDPYKSQDNLCSRTIDKLNDYYFLKCAYCERIYKLDVEHYRPSGEVTDENGVAIKISNAQGALIDHPGYYWLCYEWSNLLPSCITCNREGGKNSKFPTRNHYESSPILNGTMLNLQSCLANSTILISEQPYLLHPEIDNPENFFKFIIDPNNKGIRIEGIDANSRGEKTIVICKLNRDEIKYERVSEVILPIKNVMISNLKLLSSRRKDIIQFREST
ncbi:MAG: hypothetical protein J0M25_14575, partial [Flavobacteriales bacterium]|nr:hypothetical protein [Flavobacteriales bacterium]